MKEHQGRLQGAERAGQGHDQSRLGKTELPKMTLPSPRGPRYSCFRSRGQSWDVQAVGVPTRVHGAFGVYGRAGGGAKGGHARSQGWGPALPHCHAVRRSSFNF